MNPNKALWEKGDFTRFAARFFVELDPNRVHVATGAGNAVDTARHLLY
jgi:hypothetical protein